MQYLRVRQIRTNVVIVHRRAGRARIRSKYDVAYGGKGKWGLLCGRYTTGDVNTTTDASQVTCMTCLKRME